MRPLYLGLVHGPVQNKRGEIITTSVTNMDIHDISRSCKTFDVKKYFLITPIKLQHELVGRILGHWETETALSYNPDRTDALSLATVVDSIEDSISAITLETGTRPLVVVTGANFSTYGGEVKDLYSRWEIDKPPVLLLFGTGWGLAREVVEMADFKLAPIKGASTAHYNHLSVRSAVAIYLDRFEMVTSHGPMGGPLEVT